MKNDHTSVRKFRPGDIFLWQGKVQDRSFIQTIVLAKCINYRTKYRRWNVIYLRFDGVVERDTEDESYLEIHRCERRDWTFIPKAI